MNICSSVCLVLVLSSAHAALAAPRVAVVYSAWSGFSFQNEFDGHLQTLGWPFEKFENKDVAQWIGRLGEFDIVVSASVGNYENPQDMAPYREAWLQFLQRGGAILIVDASYGSVLDLWMNRLGPDYALASTGCAPHTRQHDGSDAITCDPAHPLLHVPHELPPLFRAKDTIWAHLESWGQGWTSLVTCADEKSLFVTRVAPTPNPSPNFGGRGVGGAIVVTSYFSLRGEANTPLATGLLDNLWTYLLGLRSGVVITAFDAGPALPGDQTAVLELRNASAETATYEATLHAAWEGGPPAPVAQSAATVEAGGPGRFTLPYPVAQRGELRLSVELTRGGQKLLALDRTQTIPPMLTLKLNHRHLYPWNAELPFSAAFVPDAGVPLADCTGELLIDGQPALRLEPLKPAGEYTADVSELPGGLHRATLRLARQGQALGVAEAEFYRHPQPRVYSRPDGATLVDGQTFFPFGWYHVSWTFTAEDRLAFLRDIAAGGFNTVHAGIKDLEEWGPFLDEAERLGVHVVTEFSVDPIQVLGRYRDKPAVLAWNPGDEPDGAGVSPEEMLRRFDQFKAADPDHPTYMVLCIPSAYARYAGCAEIIAPDPYPLPHSPTALVYTTLTAARAEAAKHGRPIWGVLQCFGYPQGTWRVPTFAECRNMTYLALLAGVKGIIYYTYADSGFKVIEHPELWAAMQTLPPEIQALRLLLLDGQEAKIDTGLTDVFAGAWTLGPRVVVCVVNTSNKEAREVSLTLPPAAKGAARPMFPNRPASLAVQDGKLSGSVGPLEVQVYEFGGGDG